MKTKYIISGLAVASLALVSCSDFETNPEGNKITSDQKSDIVSDMPERSQAGVRAIFATMNNYEANYEAFGKVERHNDIGYPSVRMPIPRMYLPITTDTTGMATASTTPTVNIPHTRQRWYGTTIIK